MSGAAAAAGEPSGGGRRRGMLAKVHIARKELALDDAAYGDVLERVTGQSSAARLTDAQLDLVLREFRRLGWTPRPARKLSNKAQVRMIYALWRDLRPHLTDGSGRALQAFTKRVTVDQVHPLGVHAPEFLDPRQCNKVIEALKAWLLRAGKGAA